MPLNEQTPLEKVLASVPITQPMYLRDLRRRIKGIPGAKGIVVNEDRIITPLELIYIRLAVAEGRLSPDDFELYTHENGVFHIEPDGGCEKLLQWDYLKYELDCNLAILKAHASTGTKETTDDENECDCGCSCGCGCC